MYTEKQKREIVDGLKEWNKSNPGSAKEYFKSVGVSSPTFYIWRKELRSKEVKSDVAGAIGLEFNIIQEKEARQWTTQARSGRFMELKEGLLSQVRNLRRSQAITFMAPKDLKEVKSVHTCCSHALKKAGLPFQVFYSKTKGLFVVTHRNGDKP